MRKEQPDIVSLKLQTIQTELLNVKVNCHHFENREFPTYCELKDNTKCTGQHACNKQH